MNFPSKFHLNPVSYFLENFHTLINFELYKTVFLKWIITVSCL